MLSWEYTLIICNLCLRSYNSYFFYLRHQIFWSILACNGFLWEIKPFFHKISFNILPTALINGPNLLKSGNKDLCNFISIAMAMSMIHTFLVVSFPSPISWFMSVWHKTYFMVQKPTFYGPKTAYFMTPKTSCVY